MFTRELVDAIQRDLNEEAKRIAARYGVEFKNSRGRYSETEYGVKINFETENENGLSADEQNYINNCEYYGMKKEWLGKNLTDGTTIIGLSLRNRKYPVLLENKRTGKKYKCSHRGIELRIAKNVDDSFTG